MESQTWSSKRAPRELQSFKAARLQSEFCTKDFFRATNFLTKNAPKFSPTFLSLCSVGQKKSPENSLQISHEIFQISLRKIKKKFTDELLQERRENKVGGCKETRQPFANPSPTPCQPFANPSPTPCQPFANLSPTLCRPFLPTPLQVPLCVGPNHGFIRAAPLQNETAPEKFLIWHEEQFEKREKRSEKRSETCLKIFLAPLRPLKSFSPAL